MKSVYNKLTRMYWGANKAKHRTHSGGVQYRAIKKAARRLDARIAREGN